jgi:hypothetical protein
VTPDLVVRLFRSLASIKEKAILLWAEETSKREAMGISSASQMAFRALREGLTTPVSIWLKRLEEHLQSSAILARVRPFSLRRLRMPSPISPVVGFIF